ncbi:MAG: hypothetical protein ACI9EF_000585 [Pseudohongiellaceae bacterium]
MKRSSLLTIFKLVFAASLIFWVVDSAGGPAKIAGVLSSMDRGQWFLGLGVVFLATCISMLRWHFLMTSVGLYSTPWLALRLGFIGVFFNNVVPGLTGGDLIKAVYVTRENPDQRSAAVVSVIVDRIIGIVALALIAAVVIPFNLDRYGQAALGIYGFLFAASVGAVFTLSRRAKAALRSVFGRLGLTSETRGAGALAKIDEAVSMYRNRVRQIVIALGISVVVHMLIIVAISIFAGALINGGREKLSTIEAAEASSRETELNAFAELELDAYCSVIPIIMIGSAIPVAPAGWGVGEKLFEHFFGEAGVAKIDAATLSLTYRLTATLVSLLGGILLLLDRKRIKEAQSVQVE